MSNLIQRFYVAILLLPLLLLLLLISLLFGFHDEDSSTVGRAPDLWSKCPRFNSRLERREFFLLQSYVLCWFLFSVRSTPALPQWHIKDPGHSAESAGDRLHLNIHTPLTQRSRRGLTMLSRHSVRTYKGNEFTRNSSGHNCPQSF